MSKAKRFAVAVPMTEPGQVLRRCVLCGEELREGQHWRRLTAPDGGYAVAVHDECLARRGGRR